MTIATLRAPLTALIGLPKVTLRAYKRCGCCDAIYSREAWLELPYLGRQREDFDGDGPPMDLEFRNCPCGATLVIDHCDGGL